MDSDYFYKLHRISGNLEHIHHQRNSQQPNNDFDWRMHVRYDAMMPPNRRCHETSQLPFVHLKHKRTEDVGKAR